MDTYLIYLRTYAKVASGVKLTDADFLDDEALPEPLDLIGHLAITLASHDAAGNRPLRPQANVEEEIVALLPGEV